jgi:hypothetical protein
VINITQIFPIIVIILVVKILGQFKAMGQDVRSIFESGSKYEGPLL